MIDSRGKAVAFTGPRASAWAGHRSGSCAPHRGTFGSEAVVDWMVEAYEVHRVRWLCDCGRARSGSAAGGDKRGMQSAADAGRGEERRPVAPQ